MFYAIIYLLLFQNFAETEKICEMGMCGGAVVVPSGDSSNSDIALAGMIEGIVKTGHEDHPLEGHVSFIDSNTLETWLNTEC